MSEDEYSQSQDEVDGADYDIPGHEDSGHDDHWMPPDPGPAGRIEDYQEALEQYQQEYYALTKDYKAQEEELATLKARGAGRRPAKGKGRGAPSNRSLKGPDAEGYFADILKIGKSFAVLYFPWLERASFTKKTNVPLATPAQMFASTSKIYPKYLTAMIYKHVPSKYHRLIPDADFTYFSTNFMKQMNAQRSNSVKSLKTQLPPLLMAEGLLRTDNPTEYTRLLLHPEDDRSMKCSVFPPFLYPELKKAKGNVLLSRAPPLARRYPSSLVLMKAPDPGTVGFIWGVKTVTAGAVAFTVTVMTFVIYWASMSGKEDFRPTGPTSKIEFREIFMRIQRLLMEKPDAPGIKKIYKSWNDIVFHGVTTAAAPNHPTALNHESIEDELAEELAALDLAPDEYDEYQDEDEGGNSESMIICYVLKGKRNAGRHAHQLLPRVWLPAYRPPRAHRPPPLATPKFPMLPMPQLPWVPLPVCKSPPAIPKPQMLPMHRLLLRVLLPVYEPPPLTILKLPTLPMHRLLLWVPLPVYKPLPLTIAKLPTLPVHRLLLEVLFKLQEPKEKPSDLPFAVNLPLHRLLIFADQVMPKLLWLLALLSNQCLKWRRNSLI
ncbi:hypothetical protein DFH07DRAFT_964503 [Mycena maculata]|uniref:Uncharacterized protein n=1 Tax=Mycena maculata TaxID=230809 RepID=A0AAD7IGB0_9AGAR|nr:hypothetical protein DFH07DRAFT_964503 [Mycena maculata]